MKLFKCLAIFAANTQACIPPLLFVGTTEACIPPLLFAGSTEACIPPLRSDIDGSLGESGRKMAAAGELNDNDQAKAGCNRFIAAVESLDGKIDSDNLAVIEHKAKNVISNAFDAFPDFTIQCLAKLHDKNIKEGATPEFIEFINDMKHFTQNLINSN